MQDTPVWLLDWDDPLEKDIILQYSEASLVTQTVKNSPAIQETYVGSLGWEDPLEEGVVTHANILALRIPMDKEPGGLQSMRLQRVGYKWAHSRYESNDLTEYLFLSSWASKHTANGL